MFSKDLVIGQVPWFENSQSKKVNFQQKGLDINFDGTLLIELKWKWKGTAAGKEISSSLTLYQEEDCDHKTIHKHLNLLLGPTQFG